MIGPKQAPIANRADGAEKFALPVDGWFQMAPMGEFPHAETGTVQVIDNRAVDAMAAAFAGAELLVDFDHGSLSLGSSSRAAGWIEQLAARPDGLYAQARWTSEGRAALEGGVFRYISPVWLRQDVESLGGNRLRPLRVASAGLTNVPNLIGMKPMSNRMENRFVTLDDGRVVPLEDEPPLKGQRKKNVRRRQALARRRAARKQKAGKPLSDYELRVSGGKK